MAKISKGVNRAIQFLPFNSLRGYYTMVKEKERIKEKKKLLSQEVIKEINDVLVKVDKGMMVEITHYDVDCYIKTIGLVSNIDPINQSITIVKTVIKFNDILKINLNEDKENNTI